MASHAQVAAQLLRNAVTIVKRQTAHTIKDGEFIPSRFAKKDFIAFVDPAQPLTREMMEKAITMEFRHVLATTQYFIKSD